MDTGLLDMEKLVENMKIQINNQMDEVEERHKK